MSAKNKHKQDKKRAELQKKLGLAIGREPRRGAKKVVSEVRKSEKSAKVADFNEKKTDLAQNDAENVEKVGEISEKALVNAEKVAKTSENTLADNGKTTKTSKNDLTDIEKKGEKPESDLTNAGENEKIREKSLENTVKKVKTLENDSTSVEKTIEMPKNDLLNAEKVTKTSENSQKNGSEVAKQVENQQGQPTIVAQVTQKVNREDEKEPKKRDVEGGEQGESSARERAWRRILARYPEANFLQSPEWAEANREMGHRAIWGDLGEDEWCLMLVKNAKRGRYLEVPGGPLLDWQDEQAVARAFAAIRKVAQHENCVFVRLRPQLMKSAENQAIFTKYGARVAPMHLHAEHTVILDLTQSEDDLLKAMRRQTRYEVRQAAKKGIEVTWGEDEDLYREFHQVQHETALRQHFVPPNLDTLLAERKAFGQNARIYVARTAEGQPIAYGLIFWSGSEGEYFEAASTDLNRKLPGSYAIIWQAMRDLKALGLKRFNLWGIAPPGEKNHRYSGVTTFKTGFGGEVVEFLPAQDLIIQPNKYKLNLLVEKIRKKWRHL